MEKFDRLTGFVFLILSLGICLESVRLSLGVLHRPGPGFISFIAGVAMGVLSLVIIIRNISKGGKRTLWPPEANKKGVGTIIGLLLGYALLLDLLGFLATTILFFLFTSRFVAHLSWRSSAVLAISSSVAAYLIFQVWLKTQLPTGILA